MTVRRGSGQPLPMMVSRARSIIAVEPDDTDGRMYRSISHGFLPVSEFRLPDRPVHQTADTRRHEL
jgi:hypothetical protein